MSCFRSKSAENLHEMQSTDCCSVREDGKCAMRRALWNIWPRLARRDATPCGDPLARSVDMSCQNERFGAAGSCRCCRRMRGSRPAQTVAAQAIAARGGYRQFGGFLCAPAITGEIAAEFGAAGRTSQASARRGIAGQAADSCPICHASGLRSSSIFMHRSSAGAVYS